MQQSQLRDMLTALLANPKAGWSTIFPGDMTIHGETISASLWQSLLTQAITKFPDPGATPAEIEADRKLAVLSLLEGDSLLRGN